MESLNWPEERRRAQWLADQPAAGRRRFYWWESLTESALAGMRLCPPGAPERHAGALLAVQATREAVAQEALPPRTACVRLALLAEEYGDPLLDVDELVREALLLAGSPVDVLADPVRSRGTRHLLRTVAVVADRIRDQEVRRAFERWLSVWDRP